MKVVRRQLFALLLAVALGSALCLSLNAWDNKCTRPGAQPMNGLLILSEEELARTELHFLIRDWAFYPGALLTPDELSGAERYMVYTSVGQRTRFDQPDGRSPHGSGTYALTLSLPEEPAEYALELPEVYSACRLYLNGHLALQLGEPDPEAYLPRTQSRVVTFQGGGLVTIVLAVSDFSHFYSGLVYPPVLGAPQAVSLNRDIRLWLAVCVSLAGLLGAVFSCCFGLRARRSDALLFALLCLTAALFTAYPLLHAAFALPPRPWYALESFGCYLMMALVVVLQNRLCLIEHPVDRAAECVSFGFSLAALCYGLCAPHLSVPVMRVFSLLILLFKVSTAFYLLAAAFSAVRRRVEQAAPLLFASVFYGTLLLWDRLLPAFEPVLTGWFVEWGSLVMILVIGYVLWWDIAIAYTHGLALAAEYRQMERQLAMQTEYVDQLSARAAENRRLVHDFRHHLRTLSELAVQLADRPDAPEAVQLQRYLEELSAALPQRTAPAPGCLCSRAAVDALLQYYQALADRQGIRAQLALQIPEGIPLSDLEWCTLLGNLLENAMEACQSRTEEPRSVTIAVRITAGTFFLLVENSYDGQFEQEGRRFISRKRSGRQYGVGLESVRETVRRCGGTLDIYPLGAVFRVGITLPIPPQAASAG